MEKYIVYPFDQATDLTVSRSVVFDACGIWRLDAAAEQHMQRLAAGNVFGCGNYAVKELHGSELQS